MKELIDYIEHTSFYAIREEVSAADVERLMHNAFGASEMFTILHPEYEQIVATNWNHEWKPMFEKIIRQKYL